MSFNFQFKFAKMSQELEIDSKKDPNYRNPFKEDKNVIKLQNKTFDLN